MSRAIAPWRATYTPGTWLALSAPTSVVVMSPPPARMSELINRLWTQMVEATSLDALLELMASYGIDTLPDFAAFFWDGDGLHTLVRGDITIVDTDAREIAVEPGSVRTWREEELGTDRRLRIDVEPVDQARVHQLPLVVGGALVSAIFLNTAPDARIRLASEELDGGLPVIGVDDAAAPSDGAHVDHEPGHHEGSEADHSDQRDTPRADSQLGADDGPVPQQSDDAAVDTSRAPQIPETGIDELSIDEPSDGEAVSDEPSLGEPGPGVTTPQQLAPGPAEPAVDPQPDGSQPASAPEIGDDLPRHSEDPDVIGAEELDFDSDLRRSANVAEAAHQEHVPHDEPATDESQDGGTIFSTSIAATHKPADVSPAAEAQILVVQCPHGHPNAPSAGSCRICQMPVDSSHAKLMRRPLIAGVNTKHGEFANVEAGVLVGRAPDASKGPDGAYLMRVTSPSSDISRSHLLITARDWKIEVQDLNSTNGTTVIPPTAQPFVLAHGRSVTVELGTVLDLGDGVSLRIEPPRL